MIAIVLRKTNFLLLLISLATLGCVLRFDYFYVTPLGTRSHDIRDHMNYINFVGRTWKIPTHSSGTGSEYHQPPVFYYLSAGLMRVGTLFGVPADRFAFVRGFQLALSFCAVLLLLWIGLLLFEDPLSRALFLGVSVTFPGLMIPAADVNNDMLLQVTLLLAFALLLRWWKSGKLLDALYLTFAIAFASMTKHTGLLLVSAAGAALCHPRVSIRRRFPQAVLILCSVLPSLLYLLWRGKIEHNSEIWNLMVSGLMQFLRFGFWICIPAILGFVIWKFRVLRTRYVVLPAVVIAVSLLGISGYRSGLPEKLNTVSKFSYYLTFNPVRVLSHYDNPHVSGPTSGPFWEYVYRSAYVGEWDYGDRMALPVRIMEGLGMILLLFACLGLWEEWRRPSRVWVPIVLVLVLFPLSLVVYHVRFTQAYNQDFRFISLLAVPVFYLIVRGSIDLTRHCKRCPAHVFIVAQCVSSVLFLFQLIRVLR